MCIRDSYVPVKELKEFTIPAGVKNIVKDGEPLPAGIQSVSYTHLVKKIQTGAFYNCVKLQKINLPASQYSLYLRLSSFTPIMALNTDISLILQFTYS